MAKRMGKMLFVKRGKGRSDSSNASMSVVDDNHTHYSGDGEKSVALTVNSQTTIKASNRKLSPGPQSRDSKQNSTERKGWKGLKRLVGGTSPPKGSHRRIHSKSEDYFRENKKHSMSDDLTQRNRVWSEDGARRRMVLASDKREASSFSSRAANKLDIAIRGRLDGIDILSLGGVRKSTLWSRNDAQISLSPSKFERTASSLSFDPFQITFVATKTSYGAADLVKDMILFSGGKDDCEVILEGFFPGGSDRWTVKVNSSSERSGEFLEEVISDYGDSALLWDIMWGDSEPPPTPTHMKFSDSEDEDILTLASACSVPVDLDEDSFIIDTPEHFRSVQDVATVPLQSKRFDATLKIFEKLVSGLHERNDETLRHLEGCTRHNMGMVMMCQSNFKQAREMFTEAVKIRTACLPQNHPDVAVSLVREGHTYFALEEYDQARKSFSLALAMVPLEDATRAKILNGIGAVYYQQERFSEALKEFTSALEIQRQWLDGAVRRESIVYDASITLGNMGKVFLELKEYDVAFSVFEEACLVRNGFVVLTLFHI